MVIAQGRGRKKILKPEKLLQRRPVPLQRVPNKQVVVFCHERMPRKSVSEKRKRSTVNGPCSVINTHVMERAEEVQSSLLQEFPSFIKPMVKSNVTGGFWLGLPKQFCTVHLPEEDVMIILEDENRSEHETKYLSRKTGLSGGWRGFSLAHSLVEGDVLVFQLVEPTKFKVYIVRSSSFDEVDGALGLLGLGPCTKRVSSEDDSKTSEEIEDDKYWEPLADQITQVNGQNCEDMVSELLDGIRFSESAVDFKDMTSVEDFVIVVDGLVIDSEISKHLREKYYRLCCSQKLILHEKLLEGLNSRLAAGIISETVNIADAIRASKVTTPVESFAIWEKTLKAFSDLGMEVGFLRSRLDQLMDLVVRSERIKDARTERARAEDELSRLEAKILEVKETIGKLDAEIEILDKNENGIELRFHELASAPW